MKKLSRFFLQGILYIVPVTITIYAIYLIFRFTDGILNPYINKYLHFDIPGLGILLVIILLTFLGFLGQTFIARPFRGIFNRFMEKAPLIKLIYSSLQDLFSAFVGKEKRFNQPVLVKVNHISNLEKIGFLTRKDLQFIGMKDKAAVYFPHSYNFSGELFIVPVEDIRPIDVSPSEAMKFIVSGGITNV